MMKAVIIDDEISGAEILRILISRYCPSVKIQAVVLDSASGIEAIRNFKPDLVFLDIEMPIMNGLELLYHVQDISFEVIFTTAYNHYAIQAIKHNALDYLLKPVQSDELEGAVKKAEGRLENGNRTFNKIGKLIAQLAEEKKSQKLAIHSIDGIQFIDINKIVRLNADSNYTHIILTDKRKFTVARTLKEYEDSLQNMNFFRVHKTHLINLDYVEKYLRGEGGYVIMADGTEIEVSRRKKNELIALLSV